MSSANEAGTYRAEIDGLRAISILAVVLYHARLPGFEAGYLGVDVFFVISGFLITGQLLREARSPRGIQLSMFYARRVRRLLPAFVAVTAGTSVLALAYLLPMTEQRLFGNALTRSALFYYNIAVWRGGYAYEGGPADQQVLMHTWSLGVEEQFYLVWPFICLIGLRLGRPLITILVVVIASLGAARFVLPSDPDAVFFLLPFRAWELGLGACMAACSWSVSPRKAGVASVVGVSLTLLALLSGRPIDGANEGQLLAAVGAALTVAFGAAPNPASSLLQARPMVYLGRISYAWYLWHWPLLVMARSNAFVEEPGIQWPALAAGLVLAGATYLLVERTTRTIQIRDPSKVLVLGAGAICLVALAGWGIEERGERIRMEPDNAAIYGRLRQVPPRSCETQVELLGCDLTAKRDSDPVLILWGDSFARALSPALVAYARDSGAGVRLIVQPACPPMLGAVPAGPRTPSRPDTKCRDLLSAVEERLRRDPAKVAGVILAGRWPVHVVGGLAEADHKMFDRRGFEIRSSAVSRGLEETLDFLGSIHLRVLIVGAPPAFPFDVPSCLLRSSSQCSVSRSWKEAARDQAREEIDATIQGRHEVRFSELFDPLCPAPRCNAGTIHEPLLSDKVHFSAIAAQRLVLPILKADLDWLRGIDDAPPSRNGSK